MATAASTAGSIGATALDVGGGVLSAGLTAVVNNLFQSGVIKAQKDYINTQTQLALLSNQQQEALALQLQNSNNANDQLQIITNAIAQVDASGVSNTAKQKTTLLILVVSGAFVLLVSAFLIHKSLSK